MRRSLYGSQTAGASWRDWLDPQIYGYEDLPRPHIEPAMFGCSSTCLFLAHYADDVLVVGPTDALKDFMKYIERVM